MGFADTTRPWPDAVVAYLMKPGYEALFGETVFAAMTEWERADVRFVRRNQERAYVEFLPALSAQTFIGCLGARQPVGLKPDCTVEDALHEIGHVLGLLHEHSRPDRDGYVGLDLSGVPAYNLGQFAIVKDGTPVGDYDFTSIMHYSSLAFASGETPTLWRKPDHALIGKPSTLSPGDLATVRQIYGLAALPLV